MITPNSLFSNLSWRSGGGGGGGRRKEPVLGVHLPPPAVPALSLPPVVPHLQCPPPPTGQTGPGVRIPAWRSVGPLFPPAGGLALSDWVSESQFSITVQFASISLHPTPTPFPRPMFSSSSSSGRKKKAVQALTVSFPLKLSEPVTCE